VWVCVFYFMGFFFFFGGRIERVVAILKYVQGEVSEKRERQK